jgi:hypothetical protein
LREKYQVKTMMKMKNKTPGPGLSQMNVGSAAASGAGAEAESTLSEWELRPGGMLVQKRTDSDHTKAPPPTIRVRVKYGSTYHDIYINSQATFGKFTRFLIFLVLLPFPKKKVRN